MSWQVISAAGAVDHDEVCQLAEKAFGGLSSDPTTASELIDAVRPHPPMRCLCERNEAPI